MFSGIIEAVGRVISIKAHGNTDNEDRCFQIDVGKLDITDLKQGDSIAINGVCLTALECQGSVISFDVSNETLSCTNFSDLKIGSPVNLERALRLSDRINGHLVSGHVDTVAEVLSLTEDARSWRFEISLDKEYAYFVSHKGSICIDGVSLTVNSVSENSFSINIIPHTLEQTLFKEYRVGSRINIEVDMMARYLERLMQISD